MADFKDVFAPPVPTAVDGQRAVTDIVTERVKVDISDEIYQYDPNASSLTLLLSKLRKARKVSQYLFHILEKDRYFRFTNVTTGIDANDTSLTVDDPSIFAKNFLVRNQRTGDVVYVTATGAASTNPLTINRYNVPNSQPWNVGDRVEVLAPTYEEGARLGLDKSVKERLISQRTSTIRTSYSFTGRDENTDMFGGKDPMLERKWQGVEHAISIEEATWFSVQGEFTGPDGKKVTTMDGVHQFVKDNVWDVNGIPFTKRSWTEWLEYAMRFGNGGKLGSRTKYLFAAPRFLTEIESWAHDHLYLTPKDKIFGIDAMTYLSNHGRVIIMSHPLFEDKGDIAYLLDLNHLRRVYHQGRDTQLLKDRAENDRDGSREEIRSDVSVEVQLSKAHGFIRNIPLS